MPLHYFGNLPHVGERKDGPAAPVVRVFKAHQLGGGHGEGDGAYGLLQAVQVHGPVGGVGDLAHDDAAQSRGAAHLVVVDVGLIPDDDLLASLAVREDRDEVAHRACGNEERGLLSG